MSLQDRVEKFLYGQVMWSGQVPDPKGEAATIAAMLLALLREGPWFDEAAERVKAHADYLGIGPLLLGRYLTIGECAELVGAALGGDT